ncbi:DEAD/DEAH box helicase [Bacillus suaedae]|uniref:DEAD/DEAH box helicase n=1 Tax=Halalkalibacter suaedae TaxID=2822140 RepID=UPI003211B598
MELIQLFMLGKRLLRTEIPFPKHELQPLIENQTLMLETGLINKNGKILCRRCGNKDKSLLGSHPCAKCQSSKCMYCRHCLTLGKISSCQMLYRWTGPQLPFPKVEAALTWEGELSSGQRHASKQVRQAVINQKSMLVWAVCGAGKTEVLFEGLAEAFLHGHRVLLATPRTDVVKELYPRLKKSFPLIKMSALYGGSKDRAPDAQLVIATTHQVMRFYRAFDVVIVDEVDAFPFSFDQSLQYAVEQAQKQLSALIYLSATPDHTLLQSSDIETIKIPRRFHNHPLPVPRFQWTGNWFKKVTNNKWPNGLNKWLAENLAQNKPLLLFIPSINTLQLTSAFLHNESFSHQTVHAEDPERHEKITQFRNQQIPLLLTTTILERGVTFTNVQVAVLGSENDVFTEAALVQISGRVGRHPDYPQGDICFFHNGKTKAMMKAKQQIENMNKEAGFK